MSPPKELDPMQRLFVRWCFAEAKVLLLVPVGVLIGALTMWLSDGRILP